MIRRGKAEVGGKVERKAKAARLAAAVEVQSTGGPGDMQTKAKDG